MKYHGLLLSVLQFLIVGSSIAEWTSESAYWSWRLTRPWYGVHIRVGAFNIKSFGRSKMRNQDVANVLKKIILEYDVILVQEIRDVTELAIRNLWSMVNRILVYLVLSVRSTEYFSPESEGDPVLLLNIFTVPYGMMISDRLGRSASYKEQYAFFYRPDKVSVLGTYQFHDIKDDFEREPFSILLHPRNTDIGTTFTVIGIHTKPDDSVAEIKQLYKVYQNVRRHWNISNVMIMGDMNAACSYVSLDQLQKIPLYNDGHFDWLINSRVDTTTSAKTTCAYDRILASGSRLHYALLPWTAAVNHFETTYKLTYKQMMTVSDHYPVHVDLIF